MIKASFLDRVKEVLSVFIDVIIIEKPTFWSHRVKSDEQSHHIVGISHLLE